MNYLPLEQLSCNLCAHLPSNVAFQLRSLTFVFRVLIVPSLRSAEAHSMLFIFYDLFLKKNLFNTKRYTVTDLHVQGK